MNKNLTVFVITNTINHIAAVVGRYSFLKHNPELNVKILYMDKDFEKFNVFDSKKFYRNVSKDTISNKKLCLGEKKREILGECTWYKDSIPSFFPMRFLIPEYVNYEGICFLSEPDIFCLNKLGNILNYLKPNKKLAAVMQTGGPGKDLPATSVMLFDASKLKEWSFDSITNFMFKSKNDFNELMYLKTMYKNNDVNIMPKEYNDFNNIDSNTILTHMTNSLTQPWKSGLTYTEDELHNSTRKKDEKSTDVKTFLQSENKNLEKVFFKLAAEAFEKGYLTKEDITLNIERKYIRKDFFNKIKEYL